MPCEMAMQMEDGNVGGRDGPSQHPMHAAAAGSPNLNEYRSLLELNKKSRPQQLGPALRKYLDMLEPGKTQARTSEADACPGHRDLLAQARAKKTSLGM